MIFPVFLGRVIEFKGAPGELGWGSEEDGCGIAAPGHVVWDEFVSFLLTTVIVPLMTSVPIPFHSPVGGLGAVDGFVGGKVRGEFGEEVVDERLIPDGDGSVVGEREDLGCFFLSEYVGNEYSHKSGYFCTYLLLL